MSERALLSKMSISRFTRPESGVKSEMVLSARDNFSKLVRLESGDISVMSFSESHSISRFSSGLRGVRSEIVLLLRYKFSRVSRLERGDTSDMVLPLRMRMVRFSRFES